MFLWIFHRVSEPCSVSLLYYFSLTLSVSPLLSLELGYISRHLLRRSRGSEPAVLAYVPHDTSQPVSKRSFPFWREREKEKSSVQNEWWCGCKMGHSRAEWCTDIPVKRWIVCYCYRKVIDDGVMVITALPKVFYSSHTTEICQSYFLLVYRAFPHQPLCYFSLEF